MRKSRIFVAVIAGVTGAVLAVPLPANATGRFFEIQNYNGNFMCLQPQGGSADQGVAIVQEPCDDSAVQSWSAVPLGGNHYRYLNEYSGLCLEGL